MASVLASRNREVPVAECNQRLTAATEASRPRLALCLKSKTMKARPAAVNSHISQIEWLSLSDHCSKIVSWPPGMALLQFRCVQTLLLVGSQETGKPSPT